LAFDGVLIAAAQPLSQLLGWGDAGFGDELFWGALRSLEIAACGFALGLLIGLGAALGKLAGPRWLRLLLNGYTVLFRALPELILIMLLYYASADALNRLLAGIGLNEIHVNGMVATILVLSVVQGAYATEVLRAAISAVPVGQLEAAAALGMSAILRFRRITLWTMLPNALPGLSNIWLGTIKGTALVSVVGFMELALATEQAAGVSKRYFALYLAAQVIYLAMSLVTLNLIGRGETYLRRGQKPMREVA
jgi:polar amino acid transport system permease protein